MKKGIPFEIKRSVAVSLALNLQQDLAPRYRHHEVNSVSCSMQMVTNLIIPILLNETDIVMSTGCA